MSFDEWVSHGVNQGWISAPICFVHDGYPTTAAEDYDYDRGLDPCLFASRLYGDDEITRLAVEANFPPAVWRKPR